jgi:hypothetical protein
MCVYNKDVPGVSDSASEGGDTKGIRRQGKTAPSLLPIKTFRVQISPADGIPPGGDPSVEEEF